MAGAQAMIVAGIGCKRGTSSEEIVSLSSKVLESFDIACDKLDAIATETSKADEAGIAGAAQQLSVGLVRCPLPDLDGIADKVITHSSRVRAIKGVPSIAEASALLAAGHNARLLGARIAAANATCAIAIGEGS
jgi:cobalt-precorrin 5A hydrolase